MLIEPSEISSNMVVIDCSSKDAYARAHIPGAVHLPVKPIGNLPAGAYPLPNMPG
jgi:rhodanese-related sulfurtransferase